MSINWNRDNHVRNISPKEYFDFLIVQQGTTLVQLFKS